MFRFRWLFAAALALASARTASAQLVVDSAGATDASTYLHPGDIVRLRIWREPDLSGDFPVDEKGVAVLPKIGPLLVTEQAPDSLKAQLVAAYQRYLRNPSIDVTMLRRVNILGEVRNPGLHPVDPTMTIADAVALAGGVTPMGSADKVEVRRDGAKMLAKLSTRTRIADSPVRSGDEIYVRERSWLSRNTGIVATAMSASVSLAIALFVRR